MNGAGAAWLDGYVPDNTVPTRRRRSSFAVPLMLIGAIVAMGGCGRRDSRAEADSGDFDADTTGTVTSGTRTRRGYARRHSHGWFGSMFDSNSHTHGYGGGRGAAVGAAAGGAMGFVAGSAAGSAASRSGAGSSADGSSGGTSRGGFGGGGHSSGG